jgi:hypothetical protein
MSINIFNPNHKAKRQQQTESEAKSISERRQEAAQLIENINQVREWLNNDQTAIVVRQQASVIFVFWAFRIFFKLTRQFVVIVASSFT